MPLETHTFLDNAADRVNSDNHVLSEQPKSCSTGIHYDSSTGQVLIKRYNQHGDDVGAVQLPFRHLEEFMAERIRQTETQRLEQASAHTLLYGKWGRT